MKKAFILVFLVMFFLPAKSQQQNDHHVLGLNLGIFGFQKRDSGEAFNPINTGGAVFIFDNLTSFM